MEVSSYKLSADDLVGFRAISAFVSELSEHFRQNQRSLGLYARLIEKTNFIHEESIGKHIDIFRDFCIANQKAILNKNLKEMSITTVSYSQKVFINMAALLRVAEVDSRKQIWAHLQAIGIVLIKDFQVLPDKEGEEGEGGEEEEEGEDKIQKDTAFLRDKVPGSGKESDLLKNIIETVGSSMQEGVEADNPGQAMAKMMSSGALTGLMQNMTEGMEKGDLDMGNLIGSIQGMMQNIQGEAQLPPQISQMSASLGQFLTQAQSQSSQTK